MRLFDDVEAPAIICKCGATVTGWQSKDGPCTLSLIPVADVDCYYSSCKACNAWHEFHRIRPPDVPFKHYVNGEVVPDA